MNKIEIIKSINQDKELLKEIFNRINNQIIELDTLGTSYEESQEIIQFYISSFDMFISMNLL